MTRSILLCLAVPAMLLVPDATATTLDARPAAGSAAGVYGAAVAVDGDRLYVGEPGEIALLPSGTLLVSSMKEGFFVLRVAPKPIS